MVGFNTLCELRSEVEGACSLHNEENGVGSKGRGGMVGHGWGTVDDDGGGGSN